MPEKSDKGTVHDYVRVYEEILAPYRHTAKNVLELGLFNGASLRLWERYFTKANVHGIDCSVTPHDGMADLRPMIAEGGHNIHILDAENELVVDKIFNGIKFDIIWEDCNHSVNQQLKIYSIFKKYLNKGGTYIIEDLENIDESRQIFENIDPDKNVTIVDRRWVNNRFDDVLVIITDKI